MSSATSSANKFSPPLSGLWCRFLQDVLAALKLQLLDEAGLPLYNEDEGGQRAHPFLSCKGPAWGT